jgi:hypothetical protein
MEKTYKFHNVYHYGDAIFNLRFFYNIQDILKENNIKILYYYDANYIKNIKELEVYINPSIVSLIPADDENIKESKRLWMADRIHGFSNARNFIIYFGLFYREIASNLKIHVPKEFFNLFQPEHYLENIYSTLDDKYKNLDILLVNSEPQSFQYNYDKKSLDTIFNRLTSYKVASTTFINDTINCTFNDKLTIQDIGAISTHSKYIIGTLSGPITSCFNTLTINNVNKMFILSHDNIVFNHPKIIVCSSHAKLENELQRHGLQRRALKNHPLKRRYNLVLKLREIR